MGPVLVLAQFFCIMPVINVTSKNPLDLFFKWKSIRTIYAIIGLIGLTCYTGITIYWSVRDTIEFGRIVPIIFFGSSTYVVYCFIILARKWPTLMVQWYRVESELPKYQTQHRKGKLANRIKIISIAIILLSLTEHLLSIISTITHPEHCTKSGNAVKNFFEIHLGQLFAVTPYSPLKALIGKYISILSVFAWGFMDLFVMLISVGLTTKFQQINDCLFRFKGKLMPEEFWGKQRTNYRLLCNLCDSIDNATSTITLVSFSNNLYFICVQLLNSLNPLPTLSNIIYFWFSLLYLIGRTLAVSLYAAEIYSESKKPMDIFRCVPSESWCLEVKRFSEEVSSDTVALSGMNFFYLTRGIVLSVAGTIVTYELVLIQFHEDDKIVVNVTACL